MTDPAQKSEASFLSSLVLLVVALVVTFGVLVIYAPGDRRVRAFDSNEALPEPALAARPSSRPAVSGASSSASPAAGPSERLAQKAEPSGHTAGKPTGGGATGEQAAGNQDTESMLTEAMNLVDSGNTQGAMSILEKILHEDQNNELALVEMGMIHLIDLKDAQTAGGFLERALKVNPNNKVVLSELVGVYDETGHVDAGLGFLQGLYDEHPDNTSLAMGIGQVLASQDRVAEAVPFLERAAEEGSDSALMDLADAYAQSGQPEKALETKKRVAEAAREKFETGAFANDPEVGREHVARAYMEVAAECYNQGDENCIQDLKRQLEKDKVLNGNLGELAAILNRSPLPREEASRH